VLCGWASSAAFLASGDTFLPGVGRHVPGMLQKMMFWDVFFVFMMSLLLFLLLLDVCELIIYLMYCSYKSVGCFCLKKYYAENVFEMRFFM